MAALSPLGPHKVGRRLCAAQVFCGAKPWRKAEFTSAAQVKSKGVPAEPAPWGDNAAMIGCQGYYEYLAGNTAGWELNAKASLDISKG